MCPAAASGPRAGLSARLLERKPGTGPPRGKGNVAREVHPRCSESISTHHSDVNKPGPQSETFWGLSLALGLCPLPGSALRGQVWGRRWGGDLRLQPQRLCNRPGRGSSGPAPRGDAEERLGDRGCRRGAWRCGGGWEDCRPAPRDRPREARGAVVLTQPGGGARAAERYGGGDAMSRQRDQPYLSAGPARREAARDAWAAGSGRQRWQPPGPQHVRNRGSGGGRGTDSPRLRLQAPGPALSAAVRLAPPPPPTAGVKLGPPAGRAGALASDWPWKYPPRPLPAHSLAGERRVRGGCDRRRITLNRWLSWCPTADNRRHSLCLTAETPE